MKILKLFKIKLRELLYKIYYKQMYAQLHYKRVVKIKQGYKLFERSFNNTLFILFILLAKLIVCEK